MMGSHFIKSGYLKKNESIRWSFASKQQIYAWMGAFTYWRLPMKKITIIAATCLLALTYVALSYGKTDVIEKSFKVEQGGTFYIDTDSGSIEVESHNIDSVDIRVERKGKDPENFEVTFFQNDNDVKVVGDRKGYRFWGGSGAHFIVKVPKRFDVDLRTSGGSIALSSLNGAVDAYTSGGSIKLGEINGDVDVKTSGGSIRVEEVAGAINAHTSGGSIKVTMSKQPTGPSRLTTSGGSVSAYLLPSIAVDLTASTSGGRVYSEFDVNGTVKKTRIEGEINGGGPRLILKTSGGSVNVKEI